jgi:D-lactate dehydrogenase
MNGFGCRLLGFDPFENNELQQKYELTYTSLEKLCQQSDIISLHLPLTPDSHHLISKSLIHHMKDGVMLINTSRGGLVDTKAVVQGLKTGKIGYFGMDVYEEEVGLFFEDHSNDILQDDTVARLMTFQNVLITSHQGFLTDTALHNIAQTTIENLTCFEEGRVSENEIG